MSKRMLILIARPYRSGTRDVPEKMAENVWYMESHALPIFRLGHIPVLVEWFALPLLHLAGSKQAGDEAYVGGASEGAHLMVEVARRNGLQIYTKLEQIPAA